MSRVAIVQMVSSAQVDDNLKVVATMLNQAQSAGVCLVILPENFAFMGGHETEKLKIAERFGDGKIQDALSHFARQFNLWIIAGTIPIKTGGSKVRASSLVYNEQGLCIARYDKIHLFDVVVSPDESHRESSSIERGDKVVVVDTPVGRVGLSVCYDLRFPELYQSLMLKGAEVFAVPSAFTATTGKVHWDVLLRARAIENLCYVLAANQGGQHQSGRHTHGHSMMVEPWGHVVGQCLLGTELLIADIDLQRTKLLRQQFPCNAHHVLHSQAFAHLTT